jgi:hypothetical protein
MKKHKYTLDEIAVKNPSLEGRGRCYVLGYYEGQRKLLVYLVENTDETMGFSHVITHKELKLMLKELKEAK